MPGFTLALGILHPCIALAIYLSTCLPLPQQLEASPPPLGNIRHAAGRRSGLSSCGAYRRPPLRSGLRCHSPSVLSRAHLCATFRVAKPHDSPSALRHGADNRQKGALCAFPPAGYYGHEERLNWIFLPRFRLNVKVLTLNARFGVFGVNSARKSEGVGVRGQGKVAFSHALRLPLPRKLNVTITEVGPAIMWPGPRLSSLQEKVSNC